jgi:AcrR family transcriptional regulator
MVLLAAVDFNQNHTKVYGVPVPPSRLTLNDWTDLGLRTLEDEGFTALRVDRLARKLGVSRGSFYWHFADVEAYEAAILARWRELVLAALDTPMARSKPPLERLSEMMTRSMQSQRRVEMAMRAWATTRPALAQALTQIDERRISYMRELVGLCGVAAQNTLPVAQIVYWTYLGHAIAGPRPASEIEAVVAALLELVREQIPAATD